MKGLRTLGAVAGLLLAAGAAAAPAVQASVKAVATRDAAQRDERRIRRLGAGEVGQPRYIKRNGWSVAQDRRNARHARNVRRNRAAHR